MIEIRIGKICSKETVNQGAYRTFSWQIVDVPEMHGRICDTREGTYRWKTFAITIAHSSDVYWKPYLFIFPRAFHRLPLHNRSFARSFVFVLSLFHIFLSLIKALAKL